MKGLSNFLVLLLLRVLAPSLAVAHEVRPGYLDLRETRPGLFETTWKVPGRGEFRLAIEPIYPQFCRAVGESVTSQADNTFIERRRIHCERGLSGARILIGGLEATQTDVLVNIRSSDGGVVTARLTPSRPDFVIPAEPSRIVVFSTYLQLGVEHILTGVDHLLFRSSPYRVGKNGRKFVS